jgi:hypothetical protein
MFKENCKQPTQPEVKKPKLIEVLTNEIYSSIVEIGKKEGFTLEDSEFVDQVFWALTNARLRLYNESNKLEQED